MSYRGYLTSGRAMADWYFDEAMSRRRYAQWLFRNGLPSDGKDWMHQALRAFRNFRFYRSKVQ